MNLNLDFQKVNKNEHKVKLNPHPLWRLNNQHNNIQHIGTLHKRLICDTQHKWHSTNKTFRIKNCLYAQCHYAKCHYAECPYAKCHYAEWYFAEWHYAECHYAECNILFITFVECHYAKCRYAVSWRLPN